MASLHNTMVQGQASSACCVPLVVQIAATPLSHSRTPRRIVVVNGSRRWSSSESQGRASASAFADSASVSSPVSDAMAKHFLYFN